MIHKYIIKIGFFIGFLAFIIFGTFVYDSFLKKYPGHQNDFLYDPYLMMFWSKNRYIQSLPVLKRVLTFSFSTGLDLVGSVMVIIYCLKEKNSYFIVTLILFQVIRIIALNIVIFPVPETFILEDPGISSISTAFDRTNDLYYSGHIGTVTIFLFDCVFYRRKFVSGCLVVFLFYTGCFLLLLGVHFMNDIIIGFVVAMTICRCVYKNRFYFSLGILIVIAKVCFIIDCCKKPKDKKAVPDVAVLEVPAAVMMNEQN